MSEYEQQDVDIQSRMADSIWQQNWLLSTEVFLLFWAVVFAFFAYRHAHKAAVSAKGMLETENRMLEAQHRGQSAWISLLGWKFDRSHIDTQFGRVYGFDIRAEIINTGPTPAQELVTAAAIDLLPAESGPDQVPLSTSFSPTVSVGPNRTGFTNNVFMSTDGFRMPAELGTKKVVLWFQVNYRDIFRNHDDPRGARRTEVCVIIRYRGDPNKLKDPKAQFGNSDFMFEAFGPRNYME